MAKTDSLKELKNILEDKSASDSVVLRLFIAYNLDKEEDEEIDKVEQKKINDKVDDMYVVYKFNMWLYGLLGGSVVLFLWSLALGQAEVSFLK